MSKGIGYAGGAHGKGRLFKRGGRVWWIQYYARGQQVRESSHSDKKAVAEKLLMRRLVAADDGTLTAPVRERPLAYEEIRERLATAWLVDKPGISRTDVDRSLARLDEFFSGMSASVITEEKIAEFKLARKATGASNATVNRALAALRQMFRLSAKRIKNPPEIKFFPEPPARKGFVERDQYLRLWAVLPEHLRPITAFAYYTGMRLGELKNLTWKNVDVADGIIRLEADQTKSGEGREIPFGLVPELAELMTQLRTNRASSLVFTRSDGKILGTFRKAWIRAAVKVGLGKTLWLCRKCGQKKELEKQPWPPERQPGDKPACVCGTRLHWHYDGLIFHDLRRTAVRNLRRAGVPESVAMTLSGHKTREVFERYNIKDRADRERAMESLNQFIRTEDRKLEGQQSTRPN